MALNEKGHEVLDQTPLTLPVKVQKQIGIDRQHSYTIQYDTSEEFESAEEADDFVVGEDYDDKAPWEESPYEEDTRNMILEAARREFDSKYAPKKKTLAQNLDSTEEALASRSASESAQGKKTKTHSSKTPGIKSSLSDESDDE